MKSKRGLSGIYFRSKNQETGKYESVVFEDLSESEQKELIKNYSKEQLISLSMLLANTINEIGEMFDIVKE
jgi:hypothetical protein